MEMVHSAAFAELGEQELQQLDGGILPAVVVGAIKVIGYTAAGVAVVAFAAGVYDALTD